MDNYLLALLGGLTIGIAVTLMLFFNGRVTGISGIVGGLIKNEKKDSFWRFSFVAGLIVGGLILKIFKPESFNIELHSSTLQLIIAGLLVGFGTQLGGGCTSGHGVCGMSRLSVRSIVATLTFIAFGALTVFFLRKMGLR